MTSEKKSQSHIKASSAGPIPAAMNRRAFLQRSGFALGGAAIANMLPYSVFTTLMSISIIPIQQVN